MDYNQNKLDDSFIEKMVEAMDVDGLKQLQKTKINEYTMLIKSVTEMMKNGAPKERIEKVKQSANESYSMFVRVEGLIEDMEKRKKHEDAPPEAKVTTATTEVHDVLDEEVLYTNHFSVTIGNGIAIPSYLVSSMFFDKQESNLISIELFNCVNHEGEPIGKTIEGLKKNLGDIRVDYFKANGRLAYSELYKDCVVCTVFRNALDYDTNEPLRYQLMVSYADMEYVCSK